MNVEAALIALVVVVGMLHIVGSLCEAKAARVRAGAARSTKATKQPSYTPQRERPSFTSIQDEMRRASAIDLVRIAAQCRVGDCPRNAGPALTEQDTVKLLRARAYREYADRATRAAARGNLPPDFPDSFTFR